MSKTIKRALLGTAAAAVLAGGAFTAVQADEQNVTELHFLIPGGAGGGWDGTARGTGEALTNSGLLESASFENMSGGGGGLAIAHLIETADQQSGTLMVNSTPIVIRSLQGVFPQSFRDLTPIAGTIGDYAAIVVHTDSEYQSFGELLEDYNADSTSVGIAGGSVAGGMDHLVAALVMRAAGASPTDVKYIPYDAGGDAMAGLLSGEAQALSTGFSEAVEMSRQGQVRILCVTSLEEVAAAPDAPTCDASGAPGAEFVNWRGFFGAPDLDPDLAEAYQNKLGEMYGTDAWAEVRDRNGWVDIYNAGGDFTSFLEEQEQVIGDLMRELGFL
ncbi:MAG: tripartite tricarboxylate transporter substrate-binding protein [Pseudomonadota bacterium]